MNHDFPGFEGLIPDHRLLRRIGRGSYGEVWLARSVTGVWRAVKIIRREAFAEDRPFEREFEGICRFQAVARGHEALIHLLHVGRPEGGGFYYYVMELADDVAGGEIFAESYVPGTLASELKECGRLPFARCLRLGQELARALAHLHAAGLIHRDVKPSNVVRVNGSCRLADLGLVAAAGESRSFVGTEGFVPPEGPGSPQADVYALGKVLYECLTGLDRKEFPRLPREWNSWPDARDRLELNAVILQACDDSPRRRHRSAAELLEHLDLLQGGKSVRRLRRLECGWRRMRIALGLAAGVTGLSWAGTGVYHQRAEREKTLRQEAETARLEARAHLAVALTERLRGAVSSRRAGERMAALEAMRSQKGAVPPAPALREALVGVLTRADFMRVGSYPDTPGEGLRVTLDLPRGRWFEGPVDGRLVLRKAADRKVMETVEVPGGLGPDWDIAVSADGERWALSRAGRPLLLRDGKEAGALWRTAEGRGIQDLARDLAQGMGGLWRSLSGAGSPPRSEPERVVFSPDGEHVLRGGGGAFELISWDPARPVTRLILPAAELPEFSPDGKTLACLDGAGVLSLCNALTGLVLARGGPEGGFWRVAWSPGGRMLAAAAGTGGVEILAWNPAVSSNSELSSGVSGNNTLRSIRSLEDRSGGWQTVAFTGGEECVMASGWAGWTCLWSVSSGQLLARDPTAGTRLSADAAGEWCGHHDWERTSVTLYRLRHPVGLTALTSLSTKPLTSSFPPDGRALAVGGDEGLEIWTAPWLAGQLACAREEAGAVRGTRRLLFSPDGSEVAALGLPGSPVWHREGRVNPHAWRLSAGPAGPFSGRGNVAITPAQDQAAAVSHRSMEVWSKVGGSGWRRRTVLPIPHPRADPEWDWIHPSLSPDGQWAAGGSFFTSDWWVWDVRTAELVVQGGLSAAPVPAFSPDGRWLAVLEGARSLILETGTWREAASWPRLGGVQGRGVPVWRPDGAGLAMPRGPHELTLRETGTWREQLTLSTSSGQVISECAFSPDGHLLAAPDRGGCVQIWDLQALESALRGFGAGW